MAKVTFEWDDRKAAENERKHGVSFAIAQLAFLDPHRVIARDGKHSAAEERYYCMGRVGEGVLTVRFTYRGRRFASSGPDIGAEGEKSMRKKTQYTREPMTLEVVDDFLPPPCDLVLKEDTVKVTIGLSKPTVEFFKIRARQSHTQYQKMIRRLLDLYVAKYR